MKKLLAMLMMLASISASAVTFEELGDSMTEPVPPRLDEGVIQEIDLDERSIIISGYEYLVGPSTINPPLKVTLYGVTYGAFELLKPGMKVEVEYIDFGNARVAFRIGQLAPDAQVEH